MGAVARTPPFPILTPHFSIVYSFSADWDLLRVGACVKKKPASTDVHYLTENLWGIKPDKPVA